MTSASSTRCTPRASRTARRRCSCTAARPTSSGRRSAPGSLYGLGTENANLPGFVSIAPSAGNGGPRNYGNAFLPAVYQGTAIGKAGGPASEATIRNLTNPQLSAADQRAPVRPAPADQRRAAQEEPRRLRAGSGGQLVRAGLADAGQRPGRARPLPGNHGDAGAVRHRREGDRQLRPAVPDGPAAVRGGRALRPGDLRRQHRQPGLGPALQPAQARRPRPGGGSADRRAAGRPEAARPARGHAGLVGRRVRPHALRREERHRPRPQPAAASPSGWPAAASSPASPTAPPTSSAIRPSRTRSTCTTCTPPCCTCSASTTRS